MQTDDRESPPGSLAEDAVASVRRWLAHSAPAEPNESAARLAALLEDPDGLDFAAGFADRVVRPDDLRVAGKGLEMLARRIPRVLPWYMRSALTVGGGFAAVVPWPIVPIARRVMRRMVGHLVVEAADSTDPQLGAAIARLRASGARLSLCLLGEAVLGDGEADRRLAETLELLTRDDVEAVSISLPTIASHLSLWGFDETVDRVVARLTPLYEFAAASGARKFITLDAGMFRHFDLTIAVFERLLERPALRRLEAGITLQAYLPEALAALQGLTHWASARRAEGGAGIRVRLVKGAYLPLERIEAAMTGWPLAPYDSKARTDANYKRLLHWALTPERTDAVRIGIAGHNLFDIAYAWQLAKARGVDRRIEIELMLGMGVAQDAVAAEVGGVALSVPVVFYGQLDSAVGYLVQRLDESVGRDSFLAGARKLAGNDAAFEVEAARFIASLNGLGGNSDGPDEAAPASHRAASRSEPRDAPAPSTAFRNAALTDPAVAANRRWARAILDRAGTSRLGQAEADDATVADAATLQRRIADTAAAGGAWGQRRPSMRAAVLHGIGEELASCRARLIETMVGETGLTLAEADAEIGEAVDCAHSYADLAVELEAVDARFIPSRLIAVTALGRSPVAVPAASVLGALAAGSGVVLMPARHARRSAAMLLEVLRNAGVSRGVATLLDLDRGDLRDNELARALINHPEIDRVLLTGSWERAKLFRSWRADVPLLAETTGTNAVIVTPSADLDRAVADIVASAFGSAGQGRSATNLVILVGSLADSQRFRRQLVDAVSTLRVGYPNHPTTELGPLAQPATGEIAWALSELEEGEEWLVEPHRLDGSGRLWSPGVRDLVQPDSEFHLSGHDAPVIGIMRAADLAEAIELQNAMRFALTAAIHALDADEVARWLHSVEAGNLFVNRSPGFSVQRQVFGGWKGSTVGPRAKTGGPNSLFALGSWEPVFPEPRGSVILKGVSAEVARLIEAAQPGMDYLGFDRVRAAARSDQLAWDTHFNRPGEITGHGVERNVLRYRPTGVVVRLSDGAPAWQLARVVAAAMRAGAPVAISSVTPVAASLVQFLRDETTPIRVTEIVVEADARWYARLRSGEMDAHRIRLLGGDPAALAAVLGTDSHVAIYAEAVTVSGRIELLPFLREQSVSITSHRFGHPDAAMDALKL